MEIESPKAPGRLFCVCMSMIVMLMLLVMSFVWVGALEVIEKEHGTESEKEEHSSQLVLLCGFRENMGEGYARHNPGS